MKKIIFISIIILSSLKINAQWEQVNGPCEYGPDLIVECQNNIFCATSTNIFKSDNYGNSWNSVFTLTNSSFTSLEAWGNNIFAGTYNNGVYLSKNNGITWEQINNGLLNLCVYSIAIKDSNIFAGTYGGVYRSKNNGISWAEMNTGLNGIYAEPISINGDTVMVATENGIFVTSIDDSVWTKTTSAPNEIQSFAFYGKNIYAGTLNGIYLSTDSGNNWLAINNGLKSIFVTSLTILDTMIFASTSSGVFMSTNNGSNWSATSVDTLNLQAGTLALINNNLYRASSGVYIYDNYGANWNPANIGLSDLTVRSIVNFKNNILVNSGLGSLLFTDDWNNCYRVSNSEFTNYFTSADNIYASKEGVFFSSDTARSWINLGLSGLNVKSLLIKGSNIYAGTFELPGYKSEIYLSIDNGANWTSMHSGISQIVSTFLEVGNDIIAGTEGGGVYRLTNNNDWNYIGLNGLSVRALVQVGNYLFAGTNNGVYLSIDNGNSWIASNNGYSGNVNTFEVYGNNIFAGTNNGVYLSTNFGNSWDYFGIGNEDFWNTSFYTTSLLVDGEYLYTGTLLKGIWKKPLAEFPLGISEKTNKINYSIYPNPTAGAFTVTSINLNYVEVYNVFGDLVYTTPKNGNQNSKEINLMNYPKGIYLIRIFDTGKIISDKVVVH